MDKGRKQLRKADRKLRMSTSIYGSQKSSETLGIKGEHVLKLCTPFRVLIGDTVVEWVSQLRMVLLYALCGLLVEK